MSYIVLRGRWCNIIVLNVHAPSEDKSDDTKDSFYGELEQVFDHFPKYDMKILLGDFNGKVGRENIFKPTHSVVVPSAIYSFWWMTAQFFFVHNCGLRNTNCDYMYICMYSPS